MDPEMIAGMIFVIVLTAMTGGFILLFPVSRRLGQFLEYRMSSKGRIGDPEKMEALLRAVESLRDDVAQLAERQDFTERLLERPREDTAARRQ
ncbi:MAG TPA: hypothetical protein VLH75_17110 [Longimicrobiales bacterium]|nr:hypothetical protein [Longimicrobiales bacterium]